VVAGSSLYLIIYMWEMIVLLGVRCQRMHRSAKSVLSVNIALSSLQFECLLYLCDESDEMSGLRRCTITLFSLHHSNIDYI